MTESQRDSVLETWLKEANEVMSDGFAVYDPDGNLAFCNESFRSIHGYTRDDTELGTATYDSLGLIDYARSSLKRSPSSFQDRVRQVRRDGSTTIIQVYGDRIYERHLSVTPSSGLVSIVTDITKLTNAQREAENANRAKSEFLAAMSHELRTPLNAIIGFAQMMAIEAFGMHGSPKYVEYSRDIVSSSTHLLAIINDILDLSKIEAGEVKCDPSVFPLAAAIEDCTKLIAQPPGRTESRVRVSVSGATPKLHSDPRIFRQVMINLISNAEKFTPEGGDIHITTAPAAAGATLVCIADTGIGIPPEDIERVLEPFGQVRSNAHLSHKGTGLGLSISKKLMDLIGGELVLESEPNAGTTVRLTFPPVNGQG